MYTGKTIALGFPNPYTIPWYVELLGNGLEIRPFMSEGLVRLIYVGTRPISVMNCSEGTDLPQFLYIILCLVVLPVSLVFLFFIFLVKPGPHTRY